MNDDLAEVLRIEGGRIRATLIRLTGDITLAEDSVQDAVVAAMERWHAGDLPERPAAWLTTVARNKAMDRLRREAGRPVREQAARMLDSVPADPIASVVPDSLLRDDMLRLMFTCCHPALSPDARLALTLRIVAGLSTTEIARLCLTADSTMGQRISRAKKKIAISRIPYRVPQDHELPDRLPSVLTTVMAVFTLGHHATDGALDRRVDLAAEAIRLGRLLAELMPDELECIGALALMIATHARHAARVDENGDGVLLADQDRSLWQHDAIAESSALVERCLRRRRVGAYQVQAAIACLHGLAPNYADTDWPQIVQLYDTLVELQPTAVVRVNQAVALAESGDLSRALAVIASVDAGTVGSWHLFWAVSADLARRAGDTRGELAGLVRALQCPANDADRRLLQRRLDQANAAIRRASSAR